MIHDVLLSCLNLYSTRLPLEEFTLSDAAAKFLHPCEKKILQDIIDLLNVLREVARFAKIYGSNQASQFEALVVDADDPLPSGLYLLAFCNGIQNVLSECDKEIEDLERQYLQNPSTSLLTIYQRLQVYQPLALLLRKLIRDIKTQKLHGCAILQYLHKNVQHGDSRISKCIKTIQYAVNEVFLKQLTHWIMHAKLLDGNGEFFIYNRDLAFQNDNNLHHNSSVGSEKRTIATSAVSKHTMTTISTSEAGSSTYADIWTYDISPELLPHYLSITWAEKVLFIGRTVLMFKRDKRKSLKSSKSWNYIEDQLCPKGVANQDDEAFSDKASLWNDQEHIYFSKIQGLLGEGGEVNISHYELVIDEIKCFVSKRLSELALNQADLVQQLKLVKDFYLLARGELFTEFIQQICLLEKEGDETKMRFLNKIFEMAANSVGIVDELDRFTLVVPKTSNSDQSEESTTNEEVTLLPYMELNYKITWPLHLLFSPHVLERYNGLFRFLLLLKKLQHDLHMIWHSQTQQAKKADEKNVRVMHLRNQLMFFIGNLQYYIQVDVLESQYSILLNTIHNKADFEQIQRAHSVFLANVLSMCFLLSDDDTMKASNVTMHSTTLSSHCSPVYIVFNDIFHLCDEFCTLIGMPNEQQQAKGLDLELELDKLEAKLTDLIDQLINLLVSLKSLSMAPLSQLLLRLDFNQWFSSKKSQLGQN